jgi:hypothetical protein
VSVAGPGTAREPLGPGKRAAGPTIERRKEITSGPRKERERERCKTKKDRERRIKEKRERELWFYERMSRGSRKVEKELLVGRQYMKPSRKFGHFAKCVLVWQNKEKDKFDLI